ncbi:filamentous hemagglutinin [Pantoea alhagi]|uniref:two-partner secretion domain-containing protein n=1 Tax=Mixta sp. BE291 TaxID=3158787 RepID=UPI00285AE79C|nr:filamentous hemagglutinin [Pantoea alhagi]
MNRLLYRVVFSKVRGMLLVVADIARACSGGAPSSATGHNHRRLVARPGVLSFSLWLALGVVQTAQATIVADKSAPGRRQPTIVVSANGTPQINIQTPSAGGVSRNSYSRFDIDKKGAILNNSRTHASTQLGGMVAANPWLAKGEAKIILNEVNARDPSRLNGYIEVAGRRAQVVIASPSGITCNGCGFINAGRTTLTTGTAQMRNGNLIGYQVDRGEIVIEGRGLDASRQDYTDIIARAVKVNAAIHAHDLNVTAGRNQVDAAHDKTTAQSDNGSLKPQLAIDVAQVGGMYAGKIRLRATEQGVGVRNAGYVGSEAGLVTVTADGRIENSGELSSYGALQLSSASGVINSGRMLSQESLTAKSGGDFSNSGSIWASADARVTASAAVQNSGSVAARNNVTLSGSTLTSSAKSALAAGVQPDAGLGNSGDLTLNAFGKLEMNGLSLAGGTLRATGQGLDAAGSQTKANNIILDARQGRLSTASALVIADDTLTATTAGMLDNATGKIAADKLSLTARRFDNQQGQLIQSGAQALMLNHRDGINNRNGKIATNAVDLTLQSASLDNRDGEITHVGSGTLSIAAATLQGDHGNMLSSGALKLGGKKLVLDDAVTAANHISIDAGNLSNRAGQLIQNGQGAMTLIVREKTDNQRGLIAANGAISLNTMHFGNRSGRILAAENGSLTVTASGQVDNHDGMLAAANNLTVNTNRLNNDGGQISTQQGAARLSSSQQMSNVAGQIAAAQALQITAAGLDTRQGKLIGNTISLLLGEKALNNRDGVMAAQNALTVSSGELHNTNGLMQSGAAMRIDTHGYRLNNSQTGESGGIQAAGSLAINGGNLDNVQGHIVADGDAILTIEQLNNQDGLLAARQQMTVLASGAVNNDRGLIQSGGSMRLDAQQNALSNRNTQDGGGIISFGRLNVTAGAISNQNGMLGAARAADVQATAVDNRKGILASQSGMQLSAHALNNRDGTLSAGQKMALTLDGELDNNAGQVSAGGSLNAIAGQLQNARGMMVTGGEAQLNIGQIDNRHGQLVALGNFTLRSVSLNNDSGLLQSGSALILNAGQISNRESGETGGITSQNEMQINASALNNNGGMLLAGKQATLDTASFSNIAGTLATLGALKLSVQSDTDNQHGLIQGNGVVLDSAGHQLDNREGTVNSLAAMQMVMSGLNNQSGTLGAKSDINLQAAWLDNRNGGRVVGEGHADVTLERLLNNGGQIQTVGNLLVSAAQGVIDNMSGLLRSGATATLNAASLINRDTLKSEKGIEGRDIVINSRELDNAAGSVLAGQSLSIINHAKLDNRSGDLAAGGALALSGASLNLVNTAGIVKAGQQVTAQVDRLSGDGQLLSLGDMMLSSREAINNSGDMIANGNFTLTTPGSITNHGRLLAGAKLDLTSGKLLNAASGEIVAGYTWLTVANALNNQGLINGSGTRLLADTLTNSGTGRIYGDYLAIQASTLNNRAANGVAATIAGRKRVDIGAGTINNLDHALIYSDGELALGSRLNENGVATGQADQLNNHSSTIESAGSMALAARQLNNINDRFATEVVQISTEQITEYQHRGSPTRWSADEAGVFVDRNSSDRLLNLNTPDKTGHNNDNFYQYDYTRITKEDVIRESDPGKIFAGASLAVSADRVLNDKSQIVAGGTLGIAANSVDNVMPEGSRWISDKGTVIHYSRKSRKGKDSQRKSSAEYVPPTVIQSITLKPGRLEGGSQPEGSGLQIAAAQQQGTHVAIEDTGSVSATVVGSDIHPGLQNIAHVDSPSLGEMAEVNRPVVLKPGQQYEVPGKGEQATVVRVSGPNTRLPDTSLFKTHPEPEAGYLIETDPRFTNNKKWLGSDYMQNAFLHDGDNLHKHLGDGYYEQRLVREQVIALTGGRYLADYRDDEAQFKGLMNAGIAFGKQYNLIPGVALTAAQMSLLTEDMLWLVNTEVELADGTRQTVLVPQVYARVKKGDIDGSGALLGGQNLVMNLNGDLLNSGTISGREVVQLSAENITNQAGAIQGADISLLARTDINNVAGAIAGSHSVLANAGRDINIVSTTHSAGQDSFERTTLNRIAGIYVQGEDGKLSLSAGQDITLAGGQVINSGALSQTVLNAGRDLNLNAVMTSASDNLTWDKDNWLKQSVTQHAGSEVTGAGAVLLLAGQDIKAQVASVSAGDSLGAGAGRNITISAVTDSKNFESHHKSTGSNGAFSKTTITTHDTSTSETARGSQFSGDSVTMQAGNNLLVQGSSVVGNNEVRLTADNNLTITTAEEHGRESHQRQEKKAGLSGTGGIGVTYGTQQLKVTDSAQEVTHRGSTVGSVNGNVSLSAGNSLTVMGSDLVAGKDMALAGKDVSIVVAENNSTQTHTVEQRTNGLTLALSGTAGSALNTAVTQAKSIKDEGNGRILALKGVQAALSGVQAGQTVMLNQAQGGSPGSMVGVNLSYGSQSSKSEQTQRQSISQGSTLTAGNNLSVSTSAGDIRVQGSQLKVGNDAVLSASRDIIMTSAENISSLTGKNESHGGALGVGVNAGGGANGISLNASVNNARGKENGNGTTHTETTVDAGNHLSIVSGRDTTLTGAQVSGKSVTADVGRNLLLASEQDTDKYDSRQQSASAGGSISMGGGSGSLSLSRDKMHSDYASVQEQTGIFAGEGGFDVTVGARTQLDGAVIASTAAAENNRLETGTLGWRNIRNEAEYKVEHQSVGVSTGGSVGSQFVGNMANALLSGLNGSGSASSTTQAAVSEGRIVIRDNANQQQDTAGLSRDTENANPGLAQIFDKEREQQRLREAQLISEIGSQVADIARTQGKIIATKAANEKMASATQADRDRALAELKKQDPTKRYSDDDVTSQVYNHFYNQALSESKSGTGGAVQQAIQAATAAIQGLAGGNLGQPVR